MYLVVQWGGAQLFYRPWGRGLLVSCTEPTNQNLGPCITFGSNLVDGRPITFGETGYISTTAFSRKKWREQTETDFVRWVLIPRGRGRGGLFFAQSSPMTELCVCLY